MDSADLDVLKSSERWLVEGYAVLLTTVVRTWGSSPRPAGAMMAIRADGAVAGSVSGGCIEDELIDLVRQGGIDAPCPGHLPVVRSYGVAADEASRFGLPCGGTVQLVLEPLTATTWVKDLTLRLAKRQLVRRRLCLRSGAVVLVQTLAVEPAVLTDSFFETTLGPRVRLVVVGAGQLSRYFCEVAAGLGFDILVCDPRDEYRVDWNIEGVTLTREMPDDVVLRERPDSRTAVVALTHDPKLDDLALMHALQSEAFYVGALGSRVNNAKRLSRLREYFGLTDVELARLHGPAGLYIGSKTPAEIALSILAEIVAHKNGVAGLPVLNVGKAKDRDGNAESAAECRHT